MIIVVMMMVMWQHPCPFYQSFHTSSQLRKHIPDRIIFINLLESVLLLLERELYESSLPLSLSPYKNLGSNALVWSE
jgi:hypothetical protein